MAIFSMKPMLIKFFKKLKQGNMNFEKYYNLFLYKIEWSYIEDMFLMDGM